RKKHVTRPVCQASHRSKTETTITSTTTTTAAAAAAAGGGLWTLLAALPIPPALAETGADADAAAAAAAALADACSQELGGADLNTVIAVACVVQLIALIGAGVGGAWRAAMRYVRVGWHGVSGTSAQGGGGADQRWVARVRKAEVERINAQLRQINISLRKQARVESYAPSLSYAPVGQPPPPPRRCRCRRRCCRCCERANRGSKEGRGGGNFRGEAGGAAAVEGGQEVPAREGNNAAAFVEFEKGLQQAQRMGDCLEEKKAARGCGECGGALVVDGASLQRQGKYREAIAYHQRVLDKSCSSGEHAGDTEAYGAIADCYTEIGDLGNAAKYYDRYISRMESDDEDH
ncbi:unnamed protein product, partial [Closterium sp. NIES-64]